MAEDLIDWSKFNSDARAFARRSPYYFISSLLSLRIGKTFDLADGFKASLGMQYGVASKISYKFLRYGAFVEKGVGRGYPIESIKSNSAIINQASSGKGRQPKPWFNPVIDKEVQRAGDILIKDLGDIAVKSLYIR
jgi:hypothetical protein